MAEISKNLWKEYNGKGFAAQYSDYANRAGNDKNGLSLELTVTDNRVMEIGGIPVGTETGTWGSNTYTWPAAVPEYQYFLLENFVDGHSTSTVSYGEWISTVLSETDYTDNWMSTTTDNLADDTVGATLVDDRLPVDFRSYGIDGGTPYGMVTSYADDYPYAELVYDVADNLSAPFTVEFWTFARSTDTGYSPYGNVTFMRIGRRYHTEGGETVDDINLAIGVNPSSDPFIGVAFAFNSDFYTDTDAMIFNLSESDLSTLFGTTVELYTWVKNWHHYAISVDSDNIYFFIDGKKAGQKSLSDTVTVQDVSDASSGVTKTVGEFVNGLSANIEIKGMNMNQDSWDGGYAQIAACNSCKWTSDFEVPTAAY